MVQYSTGKWDYEFDVVVVGFGGAGACAAVEAHNAGARTVLIEKQPEARHYSNTRMSGGGYHSPDPNGDREALKSYARAMFCGDNLPWKFEGDSVDYAEGLSEIWADYAPRNQEFMCSLDPDFISEFNGEALYKDFPGAKESGYRLAGSSYVRDRDNAKLMSTPDSPKNEKVIGEAFFACLLNGVNSRGIPIHYETRAMKLLHDSDGVLIGVKTEHNGKAVYYRAKKAVILTSGGFEYSKALRSAFLEGHGENGWAFYGSVYNTGDGIIMGMESGAALSKAGSAAGRLITSFPDLRANGLRIGIDITAIGREHAIVVDNSGSRFFNERDNSLNPMRYINYKSALAFDTRRAIFPRIPSWFVFDETLRTRKSIILNTAVMYHGVTWSDDNHEAIDRGWILRADTIDELAEKIKAHPDNFGQMDAQKLCDSVAKFNEYCAVGEDKDFNREPETLMPVEKPPFYALPLFPGGPNTKGGLKANAQRQVVDWNGNVIPRLYAAGEIASAFKYVYQAGGNVAECIVFGRVAGIHAANEESI